MDQINFHTSLELEWSTYNSAVSTTSQAVQYIAWFGTMCSDGGASMTSGIVAHTNDNNGLGHGSGHMDKIFTFDGLYITMYVVHKQKTKQKVMQSDLVLCTLDTH